MQAELYKYAAVTDLHVVECLHIVANGVHLVVVDPLQVSESAAHLVLPELTVLVRRIAVRQSSQLLQLLFTRAHT